MGHSPTYYLAEDPWYLVGALGLVAAGFLIAMRVRQDGRDLVRALVAIAAAAGVLVVEQLWVTDAERVEWVARDLAEAVARSDADAALALMDEHVTFSMRSNTVGEELDLATIAPMLRGVRFDFVRLSRMETTAGGQTHRGQAEFRATAAGTVEIGMMGGARGFAGNSVWSLGFRRTADGAWKINRITAVELPQYTMLPTLRVKNRPDPATTTSELVSPPPPPPTIHRRYGRGRREP